MMNIDISMAIFDLKEKVFSEISDINFTKVWLFSNKSTVAPRPKPSTEPKHPTAQ
jgi:hypothetical protein